MLLCIRNFAPAALMIAALGIGLAPPTKADAFDKKTIVTFSAPVEVPGPKVLPAGTYVFKLLDSTGTRSVVQVYNKDENELYATILAIPDYRQNPTSETVMHFSEAPAGAPDALMTWFYPGDE